MQSNGGLTTDKAAVERPMNIIESGPAGGVIGAQALALAGGLDRIITFDMGGTTAKASMVEDGKVMRAQEYAVGAGIMIGSRLLTGAGYTLKVPAIDLAEVGAGGGSHVWIDAGGALQVGPAERRRRAGAGLLRRRRQVPTVTDANVILGLPEPRPSRRRRPQAQCRARRARCSRQRSPSRSGMSLEAAAYGAHQIAASNMIRAIKAVSTERGRDPREFALFAFGGNGPLFACGMAAALGIASVIVPPAPGLFSSFGLLYADVEHHYARSFRRLLRQADLARDRARVGRACRAGRAPARRRGLHAARAPGCVRSAALHYKGQSFDLVVPVPDGPIDARMVAHLEEAFGAEHERTYGHRAGTEEPVELVAIQVVGPGAARGARACPSAWCRAGPSPSRGRRAASTSARARLDRDADPAPLRPRAQRAPARSSSRSTMRPAWSRRARSPNSTARAAS